MFKHWLFTRPSGSSGGDVALTPYAHFQYQEPSGTTAALTGTLPGTFTVPLNTEVYNSITGASMTSSVITLPAGTYHCEGQGAATVSLRQLKLQDTTNAVTLPVTGVVLGRNVAAPATDSSACVVSGRFTLTGVADIELQIFASRGGTSTASAMGTVPSASGSNEVYANLEIWKIA